MPVGGAEEEANRSEVEEQTLGDTLARSTEGGDEGAEGGAVGEEGGAVGEEEGEREGSITREEIFLRLTATGDECCDRLIDDKE